MRDLLAILGLLAAVVGGLLAVLLLVCVGIHRLRQPLREPEIWRQRLYEIAPYVGGLLLVLGINKGFHRYSVEASWIIDITMTGWIYAQEGDFVASVQQLFPAEAALYFSFIYVFGYVVLLVFPLLAYAFADSLHNLKVLLTAYAFNYAIGVLCYTLVIAYGPRNVMPGTVDQPLYDAFPQVMVLTSAVNTNTNVFPSLHVSLSVTAMILALVTRTKYPRWVPVALLLGTSVVVSTMYLGIHWLTDVIAGVLLGGLSVYAGEFLVERAERSSLGIGSSRLRALRRAD